MVEERRRILFVSPHPDDETFFLGGTIAHYAREHDVYLLVLSDGEQGNIAVELENGEITRRRPPPEEIEAFRQRRRQECLEAASILGVRETTFLSYSDQSVPLLGVSGIRRALRAVDPHVVVSLSEAGTTMHPDHCWAALCIAEALRSLLREHYGRIPSDGVLPSEPPWAFRRWFTFTMPEAATRFDYFAELVSSENETVEIDVSAELDRVRRACLAYESQLHWLKFLERVKCDALPTQRFIERIAIGTSAGGKRSMLAPWGDSRKVFLDALPRAAVAYTSTEGSFFADLKSRERMFATWSMRGLILASGHGKRMGQPELPKSSCRARRPILEHIVGGLSDSLVDEAPIIVVGPRGPDRIGV